MAKRDRPGGSSRVRVLFGAAAVTVPSGSGNGEGGRFGRRSSPCLVPGVWCAWVLAVALGALTPTFLEPVDEAALLT